MFEKLIVKLMFFFNKKNKKDIKFFSKEPENILIVSNTALGDTILSTPAIVSLKKSFPNTKITAVLKSAYTPLFQTFEYIDEIIVYDGKYKGFLNALKKIKKINPELALILHSNGPQDIELCVLGGCEFILKHPTNSKLKKYLSYDFVQKQQHTIEDRLDLLRLIGAEVIDSEMKITELNKKKYLSKYQKYNNSIGLQIGAADIYKMWPIENFIELSKKIDDKIIITGVKSEWGLAQKIVEAAGDKVINLCGKCSIEELPYLIKNLKMLITNDTGTMHLAIALKVPTISLFSATTSNGIGPYQDKQLHKVIQKDGSFIRNIPKKKRDNSAMKLISVDEVFDIYKQF